MLNNIEDRGFNEEANLSKEKRKKREVRRKK